MHIGRKVTYCKRHIESVLRHDDGPLAARERAAEALKAHIDTELEAARAREAAKVAAALEDKAD